MGGTVESLQIDFTRSKPFRPRFRARASLPQVPQTMVERNLYCLGSISKSKAIECTALALTRAHLPNDHVPMLCDHLLLQLIDVLLVAGGAQIGSQ